MYILHEALTFFHLLAQLGRRIVEVLVELRLQFILLVRGVCSNSFIYILLAFFGLMIYFIDHWTLDVNVNLLNNHTDFYKKEYEWPRNLKMNLRL